MIDKKYAQASHNLYPFGMAMPGRSLSLGNYRFGFNTQEKVDEISGFGNHNTAKFWEYDTRLARRWNIDPVVKPWISEYGVFSNSPLVKVDFNGDDDYFNSKGKFLYSQGSGTQIKIVDKKNTYSLSDINFKEAKGINDLMKKLSTVSNIATHYGKQVGVEGMIAVGVDESSYAFTTGQQVSVSVNPLEGTTDKKSNDFNFLKSVLSHEKYHQADNRENGNSPGTYYDHAGVYMEQFEDKTFKDLNDGQKTGFIADAVNLILNASLKDKDHVSPGQTLEAINNILSTSKMSVQLNDNNNVKAGFKIITKEGTMDVKYEEWDNPNSKKKN